MCGGGGGVMVLARAPRSPYYQYMYLFSEVSKLSQIKFFANLMPNFCEDVICYIPFLCYVIYLFEPPTRHFNHCVVELFVSIFRHLKLELLTQFPTSNDEQYF